MRRLPFAVALCLASPLVASALAACSGDEPASLDPSPAPSSTTPDGDAAAPPAQTPPAPDATAPAADASREDAAHDAARPPDAHAGDAGDPNAYRLPWSAGTSMRLTQDCNDPCCSDHVGDDGYAWDFANGGSFLVVAARGGTITHLKIDSTTGCGSSSCVNDANYIVVDHGDGTQSTYLHLTGFSLQAGVACGATVTAGQPLAMSGTTGWSSGTHLHFQVNGVHPNVTTCECGSDGQGCPAGSVNWSRFWVTGYPTVPISFIEWPAASKCAARRIAMPPAL